MKKSLIFVVLMVLLVISCGGEIPLPVPTIPIPPPTPGPRIIPPFLSEESLEVLPPKVGMIFLVDRSNSLKGCAKVQPRIETPYFWFRMFKTMPEVMPEWPKIGVSFFGNETYLPLQSASQASFNVSDYSSKLASFDKQNQYADYLQSALDTLSTSGAEEKIIVLVSDGRMDDYQNPANERAKIRDWFHPDGSQKRTDVRVVLFHLDCGTPDDDLEMWENAEQIGSGFVFRGFDTSKLGVNMQQLAQNTSIAHYLPDSGGWWIDNELENASFSKSITLPGDTYVYDVNVVTNSSVGEISVEGESALDIKQSGVYSNLYKFEEGPAQYCGDRTMTLRTEKVSSFFAYYYVQPNALSDFFDPSFLTDNAAFFSNGIPLEGSQYIFWNDQVAQMSIPNRLLEANMAFELMDKYSICYEVWVSAPSEKNEAGVQESKIDIVKRSLRDFMSGAQILDLNDVTFLSSDEDIPIWVDVVKFPGDSSKFQTTRRQELILSYHYHPEYQAEKSFLDTTQASIHLKYALSKYYNGGELSVYALTKRQKSEVNENQCAHHPFYGGFDIALLSRSWYAATSDRNGSNAFADIAQIDDDTVIKINFEELVGSTSSMSQCGYEKLVFQWNEGTSLDKIRPSVVCDITSILSCYVIPQRVVALK